MKKLAFMFVAVAAISFASCGNKASQAETAVEADTVAMEEVVAPVDAAVDSAAVDSTAAEAAVADSAAAQAPAAE